MIDYLKPAMPELCVQRLAELFRSASAVVEYGCGGSSVLAVRNGVRKLVSVDSDRDWLSKVAAQINCFEDVDFRGLYVDIGDVGDWGNPIDESGVKRYPSYASAPWSVAPPDVDLVLIDGRFRVASFCSSILCAREGALIAFDDYLDRPAYHVVERLTKPIELVDRLAIFSRPRVIDSRALLDVLAGHVLVPF